MKTIKATVIVTVLLIITACSAKPEPAPIILANPVATISDYDQFQSYLQTNSSEITASAKDACVKQYPWIGEVSIIRYDGIVSDANPTTVTMDLIAELKLGDFYVLVGDGQLTALNSQKNPVSDTNISNLATTEAVKQTNGVSKIKATTMLQTSNGVVTILSTTCVGE